MMNPADWVVGMTVGDAKSTETDVLLTGRRDGRWEGVWVESGNKITPAPDDWFREWNFAPRTYADLGRGPRGGERMVRVDTLTTAARELIGDIYVCRGDLLIEEANTEMTWTWARRLRACFAPLSDVGEEVGVIDAQKVDTWPCAKCGVTCQRLPGADLPKLDGKPICLDCKAKLREEAEVVAEVGYERWKKNLESAPREVAYGVPTRVAKDMNAVIFPRAANGGGVCEIGPDGEVARMWHVDENGQRAEVPVRKKTIEVEYKALDASELAPTHCGCGQELKPNGRGGKGWVRGLPRPT
jgi:hypothetical protein